MVEITDPPRKRIKRKGNDTKLASDHNSHEEIQKYCRTPRLESSRDSDEGMDHTTEED